MPRNQPVTRRHINSGICHEAIIATIIIIDQFIEKAKQQQASLNELPTDNTSDYWALNDVGTCYFIKCK